MTGRKNGAFTRELDINKIKSFSKENNCTVNDTISALLSSSLYRYFQKHQNDNPGCRDGGIP